MSTVGDGSEQADGVSNGTASPRLNAETNSIISKAKVRALNKTGRVDWCLQEGVFENAYISALSGMCASFFFVFYFFIFLFLRLLRVYKLVS